MKSTVRPSVSGALDADLFAAFLTLFEDKAAALLTEHCKVADSYVHAIRAALQEQRVQAAADAAHPLRASSGQIGAIRVAALAEAIETVCEQPSPDILKLKALTEQLEHEHWRAITAIHAALDRLPPAGSGSARKSG